MPPRPAAVTVGYAVGEEGGIGNIAGRAAGDAPSRAAEAAPYTGSGDAPTMLPLNPSIIGAFLLILAKGCFWLLGNVADGLRQCISRASP